MLVLFLVTSFWGLVSSVNPGVKARLTQNGLTYANSVAHTALAKELRTLEFPDQKGKDGHIDWEFNNIENRGVTVPSSQVFFDPSQNGLRWHLAGLGAKLYTHWRVKYQDGLFVINQSGYMNLDIKNINLNVTISLGKDSTGRLTAKTASCSAHVGDVDLQFLGISGMLLGLFKRPLERRVERLLKDQICEVISKKVDEDGERELAKLKVVVEMTEGFMLDYGLTSAPVVTATSLDIPIKGKVYWKNDVREAPFTPQPIPPMADSSRMFYIWVTEYTAQMFAFAAQRHDLLQKNINLDELSLGQESNTTSLATYIDRMIPLIGQLFPNHQVSVAVRSTGVPNVTITPQGVSLGMEIKFDVSAVGRDKTSVNLLGLNVNLTLSVNCSIVDETLMWKITNHSLKIGHVEGALGTLDPALVTQVVNTAVPLTILPELNRMGAEGIGLPVTGAVKFTNTELKLLQGSLMIGADLTYTPTHDETPSMQ